MNPLPPARFEGIVIYPDPDGVFEVRYPLNWHKFDVTQQQGGILFSPYLDHVAAWVAVWKEYIPKPVFASDVAVIRTGLDQGIHTLGNNVQILFQGEEVIGNLLRLERIVTFENEGVSYKRRLWLFYAHKVQINLVYQAYEAEYTHWSGMAYYSFHTFRLPEHLWFAADIGQEKAPQITGKEGNPKRKRKNVTQSSAPFQNNNE
jgi:hypothetical protein